MVNFEYEISWIFFEFSLKWYMQTRGGNAVKERDVCGKIERKVFENRRCKHQWKYPPNSNGQWIKTEELSSYNVLELYSATCCLCACNILPNYLSNIISFSLSAKPVTYINKTRRNTLYDGSHTWVIKFPV